MRQCIETLSKYRVSMTAVVITIFTSDTYSYLVLLQRALHSGTVFTLVQGMLVTEGFLPSRFSLTVLTSRSPPLPRSLGLPAWGFMHVFCL